MEDTYTYNARKELATARAKAELSGTYQEWVGRKHGFTYDNQGQVN